MELYNGFRVDSNGVVEPVVTTAPDDQPSSLDSQQSPLAAMVAERLQRLGEAVTNVMKNE